MSRSTLLAVNYAIYSPNGNAPSNANDLNVDGSFLSIDKRNNIKSNGTRYDTLDFYINYLESLQSMYNEWTSSGYFDLGMVPLAMGPSPVHNVLRSFMIDLCMYKGIKYYEMHPVSLIFGGYPPRSMDKDIWVFRQDIAKIAGTTELGFSVINFLNDLEVRKRWQEAFKE